MKNQAPELERQRSGVAIKDKRALVLFLFGALMLMSELPCPNKDLPHHLYALQQNTLTEAQLIRLTPHLVMHTQQNLLDPSRQIADNIPARYALFLQQPLPINRSDRQSLQLLPGVGPHLARAISQHIMQNGPLSGPEDLLQVVGIGPKTLARLQPYIRLEQTGLQP